MHPGDEVAERYRLEELRGSGPMSEVWRAHDGTLDRTVALKMLSPTADLERFRREARALAALTHENVMRVYDYGEGAAGPFMALEWLPGGTLEDRLGQGRLSPRETYRIAKGIAEGLAHLHARGLVHRDLKPANVLFDEEGRPKLGDFGLARRAAGHGTLTEAGTVLGTAAYISPEQAAGEPAGPASDVYSFGVILFRMLTGALPFVADDALALANMHRHAPAPAVEAVQPDAPPALAALTAAALRKDPALRPVDGEGLLDALGPTPSSAPDAEQTRVLRAGAGPPGRRIGRRTATVLLALLLLGASGGVLAWAITRPPATVPAGEVSTGSVAGASKSKGSAGSQQSSTPATAPSTQAARTRAHTSSTARSARATTARTTTTPPATSEPLTTTTAPATTDSPTTATTTTTAATGTTAPTSTSSTAPPVPTRSTG